MIEQCYGSPRALRTGWFNLPRLLRALADAARHSLRPRSFRCCFRNGGTAKWDTADRGGVYLLDRVSL